MKSYNFSIKDNSVVKLQKTGIYVVLPLAESKNGEMSRFQILKEEEIGSIWIEVLGKCIV